MLNFGLILLAALLLIGLAVVLGGIALVAMAVKKITSLIEGRRQSPRG